MSEQIRSAPEFFQAARGGDVERLRRALAEGVPVDAVDASGDTALILASYYGHAVATRLLLSHGADPERTNARGQSPLQSAAFKNDVAVAQVLLDHGARVDGCRQDGITPLMYAAMFDRLEVLQLLLARGASPVRRDGRGTTALQLAITLGAERARELLTQLTAKT